MARRKQVLVMYRHLADTHRYRDAIEAAGIEPVLVAAGQEIDLDKYSGVVLTGGGDVNPARYGEVRAPETQPPDNERDLAEAGLIDQTLERDMPLLAICRGLQMLNVQLGGALVQHLETSGKHRGTHRNKARDHSRAVHEVKIEPGTLLASIAETDRWQVNSRHHQAASRIGGGLRVSARDAEDDTIEALEMPDKRFVLAVQWHPEDQALTDRNQLRLFQAFAAAL